MGNKSKIEWTDASWTPIRAKLRNKPYPLGWHCEHASEGCRYCYAESINKRLGTGLDFKPGHRPSIELFLDEKMLMLPLRWWRQPRGIFVCSMTDLFADFVRDEWIDALFAVMMICPQHTFQVLTKRMARARAYCSDPATVKRISDKVCDMAVMRGVNAVLIAPGMDPELAPKGARVFLGQWPLPNVWLGVSCEDQENAAARIPDLLSTPAAVRFVSAEPLLGPLYIAPWLPNFHDCDCPVDDSGPADHYHCEHEPCPRQHAVYVDGEYDEERPETCWTKNLALDWIIVGGESGPKARPMHPDWARSIRDQCAAASVPFFFKQWGQWVTEAQSPEDIVLPGVSRCAWAKEARDGRNRGDQTSVFNVGKRAAGRLLDGREHNEMPRPAP